MQRICRRVQGVCGATTRIAKRLVATGALTEWSKLLKVQGEMQNKLNEVALRKDGISMVMGLREETIASLTSARKEKRADVRELLTLDATLRNWLGAAFSSASIEFKRVTWSESTGETLEKVATEDVVLQKVRSIRELKRRLDDGRRCFGLFHASTRSDPLAFIHVALTRDLAPSLRYLKENASERQPPTHAIFYSINMAHPSLSGLDLALTLIKNVVAELQAHFPSVHTFSTLSPIPGFMSWLGRTARAKKAAAAAAAAGAVQAPTDCALSKVLTPDLLAALSKVSGAPALADSLTWLHAELSSDEWAASMERQTAVRELVTWLVAHYLCSERSRNLPLDPVARFHLRNGASLHRVNWMGNESKSGLAASAGLMVNYVYDLSQTTTRRDAWPQFHVSSDVLELLQSQRRAAGPGLTAQG